MASRRPPLPTATTLAHQLVGDRLVPGDTAVDATVGNGHDTVFLASLVGSNGRVIGFDVQAAAIEQTAQRTGSLRQVVLHEAGHERIGQFVEGPIQAFMFNLGYLPGSDKTVTTLPHTTIEALRLASARLESGGIITIALYTGHAGGQDEADAVTDWARRLPQDSFTVSRYQFLNQENSPPHLVCVGRR